jgi:Flp pilus assembly protein TadG
MTASQQPREWARWWRADRGSATTEITLAAPLLVLLLVLVGVVIHRNVDARIRLDDAAHQAARAASLEHTPATAATAAKRTATRALTSAGLACRQMTVTVATNQLRPGGTVTVTVDCIVDLGDALIFGEPTKSLSARAVEPINVWRSTPNTRNWR